MEAFGHRKRTSSTDAHKTRVTAKLRARAGGGREKREREREGRESAQEQGLALPPVRNAGDVVSPRQSTEKTGEKRGSEATQHNKNTATFLLATGGLRSRFVCGTSPQICHD